MSPRRPASRAGLARFDGGGRWRVYDMAAVPAATGSVKLVRRAVVAEGVVRPGGGQAGGSGSVRAGGGGVPRAG